MEATIFGVNRKLVELIVSLVIEFVLMICMITTRNVLAMVLSCAGMIAFGCILATYMLIKGHEF